MSLGSDLTVRKLLVGVLALKAGRCLLSRPRHGSKTIFGIYLPQSLEIRILVNAKNRKF